LTTSTARSSRRRRTGRNGSTKTSWTGYRISINELRDFLRERRQCFVLASPQLDVNAASLLTPTGGWAVLLNEGLAVFIYRLARALAVHFSFREASADEADAVDLSATAATVAALVEWYAAFGIPFSPDSRCRGGK
jgi:hypothetical protein